MQWHRKASEDAKFSEGQVVLITGYDLGMNTSGGFGQRIRVPASWVAHCLPAWIPLRACVSDGGLTAGLCVDALLKNGLEVGHGRYWLLDLPVALVSSQSVFWPNWAFGLLPAQVSQKRDSC